MNTTEANTTEPTVRLIVEVPLSQAREWADKDSAHCVEELVLYDAAREALNGGLHS
jgi:hypothetical protein